jgi:transcriptional regulator with XRE-family HTH domain
MKSKERIENRIRRGREENGYRQSDLAFLLAQKNSSQVSRYEKGLIMPDSENLMKLCYSLNTLPEGLYPEITRKWREEVARAKESLGEKQKSQLKSI